MAATDPGESGSDLQQGLFSHLLELRSRLVEVTGHEVCQAELLQRA